MYLQGKSGFYGHTVQVLFYLLRLFNAVLRLNSTQYTRIYAGKTSFGCNIFFTSAHFNQLYGRL